MLPSLDGRGRPVPARYGRSMRYRSMLFGPASRLDFVEKFVRSEADIGVLDLEDATPENAKADARAGVAQIDIDGLELGSTALFVRANAIGSGHFAADLDAIAASKVDGVIVPKLETDRQVSDVRDALAARGFDGALCGGIESVAGVHRSVEICGAGVDLVYFGAEDYVTDLGGVRTESNLEVLNARSHVAMAARLAGIPALDQVVVDYGDDERFSREAQMARSLGYAGKLCIHPGQVAAANDAFTASAEEIAWARGLVAAAEAAEADGRGVVSYEGTMVDAPIIARAKKMLDEA